MILAEPGSHGARSIYVCGWPVGDGAKWEKSAILVHTVILAQLDSRWMRYAWSWSLRRGREVIHTIGASHDASGVTSVWAAWHISQHRSGG